MKAKDSTFRIVMVAKLKHGVLWEAIRKRGWTIKEAAEFLKVSNSQLGQVLALKEKPPFLFLDRKDEQAKKRRREIAEKLMELTGKTIEELFPEEFRTPEFLAAPKELERIAEVPTRVLLAHAQMLTLPKPPDEELMEKEESFLGDELQEMMKHLPPLVRHAVQRVVIEGWTLKRVAEERGVSRGRIEKQVKEGVRELASKVRSHRKNMALKHYGLSERDIAVLLHKRRG